MSKLYHFFRLIRGLNLMVMVFTMYAVQFFLLKYSKGDFEFNLDFFLLVLSLVFIAAAGNIINDYFDVKADRINKPDRLIVDKHIKRRWAIMYNWIFNLLGFSLSVYLSLVQGIYWISIVAGTTIVILWLYSMIFKRMALLGNLIVALMIGMVPIYVLLFYVPALFSPVNMFYTDAVQYITLITFSFTGAAVFINWIRELTKDISDINGDKRVGANTFPIRFGIKKTKTLIVIISILFIIYFSGVYDLYISYTINLETISLNSLLSFQGLMFSALTMFLITFITGLIITLAAKSLKTYKTSTNLYKVAMFAGVCLLFFL